MGPDFNSEDTDSEGFESDSFEDHEHEYLQPEEDYAPPMNETVYLAGPGVEHLKLNFIAEDIDTVIGLSLRDDLQDSAFEVEITGVADDGFPQFQLTRLTKDDFAKKWEIDRSVLDIPESDPDITDSPMRESFFEDKIDIDELMNNMEDED